MQTVQREKSVVSDLQPQDADSTKVVSGIPRPIEAVLAALALLGSAPLIAIAALAIRLTSSGPIFFRQRRAGKFGQSFVLTKLRTMEVQKNGPQVTRKNDARVTRVGHFLRNTKLDELPEFWNVLKGEMSLVGPRPEVPRYVDMSDPTWHKVLQTRPGLTDPVTLRFRNEEKLLGEVEGDVEHFYLTSLQPIKLSAYLEYLESRTWKKDVKVIVRTALSVISPSCTPPPNLDQVRLEVSALLKQSQIKMQPKGELPNSD